MSRVRGAERGDRGFTLPELLISVVIIATIATVMVGVTSVVLRNTPSTEARAEDARSMMGLVTWLPQDVDSTPPTGFDVNTGTQSGCSLSAGTNLLRLQWTERASSSQTVTYIANYRSVTGANGFARIQRVTCSGIAPAPSGGFTNATALNVTSDLPALPVGWTGGAPVAVTVDTATGSVPLVTFAVTTLDGDVVFTDSAPKNPAMTLPSTTAPSWKPPTPSTVVAVNTPPTTVDLAFTAHAGVNTNANLIVNDVDGDPLIVELASIPSGWTASLSSLALSFTALAGTAPGTVDTITYTVDDNRGGVVTGNVTVTIVDPAIEDTTTSTSSTTTTSTTTTTLAPQCVVTARSISPSTMKNVQPDSHNQGGGNVSVGVLLSPVVVSATTNEHCEGLEIRYDSGGVNSPPSVAMTQTSATEWSVTLKSRDTGSSETWTDGAHQIAFHSANGGSWGTVGLTVT